MKNSTTFFSVLAAALLLVVLQGCAESDDPAPQPGFGDDAYIIGNDIITVNLPHYLLRFFEPECFTARVIDDKRLISVYFRSVYNEKSYNFRHAEQPDKYPEEARIYESLCERYKDTSYSREQRMMPYWNGRRYLVNNIVSIAIVSDTDYDATHPAGSSLSDICELLTVSPRDFIASGYTDIYDWKGIAGILEPLFGEEIPGFGAKEVKPLRKRLDQWRAEDLVLAGYYPVFFTLRFMQAPVTAVPRRFTITLTDEKGGVFTVETESVSW